MPNGDAFSYVQNQMKDPRPLVSRRDFCRFIYPLTFIVEIMGIANGLRYLHSRDIFHGDLKGVSLHAVFCFACLNRFSTAKCSYIS